MAGPWEKYAAPASGGPWAKYAKQEAPKAPAAPDPAYAPEPVGALPFIAGRTARMGLQALGAIPLAAMDAGVGIRNLLTGENYQSPSSMFNEALDQLIPAPRDALGQATEIVGSATLGSRVPVPTVKGAPAVAPKLPTPKQQVLKGAQEAGYVVPPATVNPSAINKSLEGIAGKLSTAQMASAKNQAVTDRLVKKALGLSEDAPLTIEAIHSLRKSAGNAYRVISSVGRIAADEQFQKDIAAIGAKYRGAAKDFPELATGEVDELVKGLSKPEFDADSAVDLISILRDRADKAFASGDKGLGSAIKAGSKALEDAIERHLLRARDSVVGKQGGGSQVLKQFREARELIAKTYSIEKAFNHSTGSVNATKLAAQLAKGKPLSGELKQVGQFAQAFPKAAREFNESLPGISPLDFYASGGVSAMSKEPMYLLYPFARHGVRNALLSQGGQKALTSPASPWNPQFRMGELNALLIGEQGLAD